MSKLCKSLKLIFRYKKHFFCPSYLKNFYSINWKSLIIHSKVDTKSHSLSSYTQNRFEIMIQVKETPA